MPTIKAKKSLGQNFLIDEEALSDIAYSIEIAERHIIEVGPGYGALTGYILAHHPASLDMVELDTDMIEILDARFMAKESLPKIAGDETHLVKTTPIALHHKDVLQFMPPYSRYSVIANIPYYITSPILFHFLYDIPNPPEIMVIMMQEEVGEKILD
jgi:16S rRNA (adenine1518-N6/adenine1519-N6)-dimethyltransferase